MCTISWRRLRSVTRCPQLSSFVPRRLWSSSAKSARVGDTPVLATALLALSCCALGPQCVRRSSWRTNRSGEMTRAPGNRYAANSSSNAFASFRSSMNRRKSVRSGASQPRLRLRAVVSLYNYQGNLLLEVPRSLFAEMFSDSVVAVAIIPSVVGVLVDPIPLRRWCGTDLRGICR